jgi:hypothetical protein
MALLGMKKKQAFGALPQQVSPLQAYGDGSTPAMMQQPMSQPMPEEQPAKFKPNILGVIGDAMQVFGGGQATYMNSVREQQERSELMRQRAMMAQQERETGWQDWVKKKEYERANPDPVRNDTVADYEFIKQTAGEEAAKQFVMNKANPPEYRQGPDGNFYRVNTQSAPDISQGLPPGFKVKGGPVSQAPGNFPR